MNTIKQLLDSLSLEWISAHLDEELALAARKNTPHAAFLERLLSAEMDTRFDQVVQRRIQQARIPIIKTLDQFDWAWPTQINADQVRELARLHFIERKTNVVFIGTVGLGKTHLASTLALLACRKGLRVRCLSAVELVNHLCALPPGRPFERALRFYRNLDLLFLDELGYLPIDRRGADLLFQVIRERYERHSTILTANCAYEDWAQTFCNDATLTSAILDRLLHHCETVTIEGKSYRMKHRIDR